MNKTKCTTTSVPYALHCSLATFWDIYFFNPSKQTKNGQRTLTKTPERTDEKTAFMS